MIFATETCDPCNSGQPLIAYFVNYSEQITAHYIKLCESVDNFLFI